MTLSALIRKRDTRNLATAIPAIPATQPKGEAAAVARIATVAVANPKEEKTAPPTKVGATGGKPCGTGDTATASRWWLIHYPDRDPLEVACFPNATHAEILERHPDAVAAEPINQAKPAPVPACKTCAHVTGRGGCGEPVAAGLSDVVGVIRYSPDQGATCPAWLARLDGDLERRILAMAERWNYAPDELADVLHSARSDPAGWLCVVAGDEKQKGN